MKQKKILIFNKHKKLVLVACSINEAARYANVPPSNVSAACKGVLISVGNYYYRYLKENALTGLEYARFGENAPKGLEYALEYMTVQEYDRIIGHLRPVYKDSRMNSKGWKYNKANLHVESEIIKHCKYKVSVCSSSGVEYARYEFNAYKNNFANVLETVKALNNKKILEEFKEAAKAMKTIYCKDFGMPESEFSACCNDEITI